MAVYTGNQIEGGVAALPSVDLLIVLPVLSSRLTENAGRRKSL